MLCTKIGVPHFDSGLSSGKQDFSTDNAVQSGHPHSLCTVSGCVLAEKGTPDLNSKLSSGEQDLLTGTGLVEGEGSKKPDFNIRCLSILQYLKIKMPSVSRLQRCLPLVDCIGCGLLGLDSPAESAMHLIVLQLLAVSPGNRRPVIFSSALALLCSRMSGPMPEYAAEHPKTDLGAAARGQRLGNPAMSSGTQEFLTGADVLLDSASTGLFLFIFLILTHTPYSCDCMYHLHTQVMY